MATKIETLRARIAQLGLTNLCATCTDAGTSRSYCRGYLTIRATTPAGETVRASAYDVSSLNFDKAPASRAFSRFASSQERMADEKLTTFSFSANSNIYRALVEICDDVEETAE